MSRAFTWKSFMVTSAYKWKRLWWPQVWSTGNSENTLKQTHLHTEIVCYGLDFICTWNLSFILYAILTQLGWIVFLHFVLENLGNLNCWNQNHYERWAFLFWTKKRRGLIPSATFHCNFMSTISCMNGLKNHTYVAYFSYVERLLTDQQKYEVHVNIVWYFRWQTNDFVSSFPNTLVPVYVSCLLFFFVMVLFFVHLKIYK